MLSALFGNLGTETQNAAKDFKVKGKDLKPKAPKKKAEKEFVPKQLDQQGSAYKPARKRGKQKNSAKVPPPPRTFEKEVATFTAFTAFTASSSDDSDADGESCLSTSLVSVEQSLAESAAPSEVTEALSVAGEDSDSEFSTSVPKRMLTGRRSAKKLPQGLDLLQFDDESYIP